MKSISLTILFFLFLLNTILGQANEPISEGDTVNSIGLDPNLMRTQAHYEGGISKFYKYVAYSLLMHPPEGFRWKKASGVVFIQFVVEKDGKVSKVEVIKGIEETCDQFAFEIVKNSGNWIPARQAGQPVASTLTLPIRFRQ